MVDEIGAKQVGIQLYLFADFFFYASEADPNALGLYMAQSLNKYNILYAHYVEPKQVFFSNEEYIQGIVFRCRRLRANRCD